MRVSEIRVKRIRVNQGLGVLKCEYYSKKSVKLMHKIIRIVGIIRMRVLLEEIRYLKMDVQPKLGLLIETGLDVIPAITSKIVLK